MSAAPRSYPGSSATITERPGPSGNAAASWSHLVVGVLPLLRQVWLTRENLPPLQVRGVRQVSRLLKGHRRCQRLFKFLPRYGPRLGAPVGAKEQGHCRMISLPCYVDGLLVNLKLEDAWWMSLRHPGRWNGRMTAMLFTLAFMTAPSLSGECWNALLRSNLSICRHFGGGPFPWRWAPGASATGSPPPDQGETFSQIRSQAQFSMFLVGAVELIWLNDARSYPFRITVCSTKMREV